MNMKEKLVLTAQRKPHVSRRRTRRKALIALGFLLTCIVLTTVYGAIIATDLSNAKTSLYTGRDNLQRAYSAAKAKKFANADIYFRRAGENFADASRTLNKPSINIVAAVPIIGGNVVAVRQLTLSGLEIAAAGESLSKALRHFPRREGQFDVNFKDGKIDLKPFLAAKPDIDKANLHALIAIAEYEKIPSVMLLGPIKKATVELGEQLPKLKEMTMTAKQSIGIIPQVLGANGKRSYFLAIQNNAELRATGGIIGNYGIIMVDDGKIKLANFNEIHVLQRKNQPAVNAPQDFTSRYGRFKGTSMWLNANMSPDFPTVGRVVTELYKSVTGDALDGVISIDPVGLKYLLKAVGPVPLPGEAIVITDDNVVEWTLIKAYQKYQDREDRKDFLANVAEAVWMRVVSGDVADKSKLLEQMGRALSEKHMAFFSAHDQEQKSIEHLGYAGKLLPTTYDYLQVLVQNHGANKLDPYMYEKIDYSVQLRPDGSAISKVKVKLTNKTPLTGLTEYVTGVSSVAKGGYSHTWLNVYVPKGAQLFKAKESGKTCDIEVGQEKDKIVFSRYVYLAPGTSKTVELTYELPNVLVLNNNRLQYIIDWQEQPVLNKPKINLHIAAPKGFDFIEIPSSLKRKGTKVILSEMILANDKRFEVTLADNR